MSGIEDIIKEQRRLYGAALTAYGNNSSATYQPVPEAQCLRFERLIAHLRFPSFKVATIHDVGAGLCDLHGYLIDRKITHEYSGTEVVEGMKTAALAKYPGIRVVNRDILDTLDDEKYTYMVLSGTLNLPGSINRDVWGRFCLDIIKKMYTMSVDAVAFNFLSTFNTYTDPTLFYLDPRHVIDYCISNLSRFVIIDQACPLYDVTVTVFHPEAVKRYYPNTSFTRYFRS
jgi:hypothetical protein